MSMFDALGNQNQMPQQQTNPVQQIKNNPAEFLQRAGFNIPNGIDTSNPMAIINGLMQSGQIGNGRYQQVMRMFNRR